MRKRRVYDVYIRKKTKIRRKLLLVEWGPEDNGAGICVGRRPPASGLFLFQHKGVGVPYSTILNKQD
jgi:hypothetical protein